MDDSASGARFDIEDLLLSDYGTLDTKSYGSRHPRRADLLYHLRLLANPSYHRLKSKAKRLPIQRIHIACIDVEKRRQDLDAVLTELKKTRHDVSISFVAIENRGKFENINLALKDVPLSDIDWLIVVDDDIAFPPDFLDLFIYACVASDLRIAQPAHKFQSYATWEITRRYWNSLSHSTHFVECGPLTIFHRSVFAHVLPFPETRWAWGIDVIWGEIARENDFRIGVIDATPIGHLRPVAQVYDSQMAVAEARQLLAGFNIDRSNREILQTTMIMNRL